MTTTAHNCAVLRIPFDSYRLFTSEDLAYMTWLDLIADRVEQTNRENARRERQANG